MADLVDRNPRAVVQAVRRMERRGLDQPAASKCLGLSLTELAVLLQLGRRRPALSLLEGGA